MIRDAGYNFTLAKLDRDLNPCTRRGISAGVIEQVHEYFGDTVHIHSDHRQFVRDSGLQRVALQGWSRFVDGGLDRFAHLMWVEMKFQLVRIQLRHFGGFANQAIEPVALFIDDRQQILA